MDKKELRKEILAKQQETDAGKYVIFSRGITDHLIREMDFISYKEFFFYYPLDHEVSLLSLASQLISLGKRVYFPRMTDQKNKQMEFFRVHNLQEDFKEGPFHVMEPTGNETPQFDATACFVPGLAFDSHLHRLGHGAGYYDRYLAAHPEILKVGICPNWFFVPEISPDENDVPMNCVVTETTIYG